VLLSNSRVPFGSFLSPLSLLLLFTVRARPHFPFF